LTGRAAGRVVAVLGYSDGGEDGLHRVCASRLDWAARQVRAGDVVILSGWARRGRSLSEAELMLEAWTGPTEGVVCDSDARTTAENAAQALAVARSVGAGDLLVVTSRWHARRAAALFRLLARGDVRVAVTWPEEPWSPRRLVRELVRWPLVPFQAVRARRALWS
jgi:uncharacterized SAM-binding protein YcdF (DUF218 family)